MTLFPKRGVGGLYSSANAWHRIQKPSPFSRRKRAVEGLDPARHVREPQHPQRGVVRRRRRPLYVVRMLHGGLPGCRAPRSPLSARWCRSAPRHHLFDRVRNLLSQSGFRVRDRGPRDFEDTHPHTQRHRESPHTTHELGSSPGTGNSLRRLTRQVRRRPGSLYRFLRLPIVDCVRSNRW